MFNTLFFTTLYISQCVFADYSDQVLRDEDEQSPELSDSFSRFDSTIRFPKGIVRYKIDPSSYDMIMTSRIRAAMDLIESSSCVVFKPVTSPIQTDTGSWIHFINRNDLRECVHIPGFGAQGEITIVIGFECMSFRYVLHAVLHGIGFKDEVSHPQRDQYIRIIWQNIQPRYRDLFSVQQQDPQYKLVEYDPMSVMHFHDRAFSLNGGPTIVPRVPGLHIKPSPKLSQLDVMKLRMWFGHECNKRKVSAVLETCKTVLHSGHKKLAGVLKDVSVEADNLEDPYKDGPSRGESFEYEEIDVDGVNDDAGDNDAAGDVSGNDASVEIDVDGADDADDGSNDVEVDVDGADDADKGGNDIEVDVTDELGYGHKEDQDIQVDAESSESAGAPIVMLNQVQ